MVDASQWRHLYKDITRSYVKGKRWLKNIDSLNFQIIPAEVVPIGILFCRANYLEPQYLEEIITKQIRLQSVTDYKSLTIFAVSPTRDKLEQDVRFVLDPRFIFSDHHVAIEKIEIDFADGHGFWLTV